MFRKSFKSKIIVPSLIILVVLTIIMTFYVSLEFLFYSDILVKEKVLTNINSLKLHINNSKIHSRAAAITMAHDPEVIKSIRNRNRHEILKAFSKAHDLYQVNFYTITDENGIVLARTHDHDKYGDSVLEQQNIKDALDGNIFTFFEAGTAVKVSARTGVPVYDNDKMIGVVSAGVRFDTDEAVDLLQELLHSDISVFFGETRIATTIVRDGHRILGTKIDEQVAETVLDKKNEFFGDVDILGIKYKTFYMPLLNPKDEVFATIFIGTPMSELKAEVNNLILNIIIINFIALISSIAFLYIVISSISKPLAQLSKGMDNIEDGNLKINIDVRSDDEVGRAGKALQKVANTVHKLIENINDTISEHRKGNMDYHLNVEPFHGDYRLLANSIVELSNLGLKDQLTGLPNRHALNGRIDLEWNRALRDRTPISILIMDVDKFKTYNDNYGHQQGDIVLQTVSKALARPLKRGFDFIARWGGEEFIALLPNTDSKGAVHIAEEIRSKIEDTEIPSIDGGIAKRVTVSVGVATLVPSMDTSTGYLISKADDALYKAKENGRNKVCKYDFNE